MSDQCVSCDAGVAFNGSSVQPNFSRFCFACSAANDGDVATAKDFIEKIASNSSTSGKPYLTRFKDGREMQSGDYLRAELAKVEASLARVISHASISPFRPQV